MSKEQTPITAKQYLNNKGFNTDGQHFEVLLDLMEQYAQVKVLEALERVQSDIGEWIPRHMKLKEKQFNEKEKQFTKGRIDCMMQISSHIETEVKPKYE